MGLGGQDALSLLRRRYPPPDEKRCPSPLSAKPTPFRPPVAPSSSSSVSPLSPPSPASTSSRSIVQHQLRLSLRTPWLPCRSSPSHRPYVPPPPLPQSPSTLNALTVVLHAGQAHGDHHLRPWVGRQRSRLAARRSHAQLEPASRKVDPPQRCQSPSLPFSLSVIPADPFWIWTVIA